MPELPDIVVYMERLQALASGQALRRVRVQNPYLLRTARPPLADVEGRRLTQVRRLAKRIVLCLTDDYFLVIHLMIAGRLRWREPGEGPALTVQTDPQPHGRGAWPSVRSDSDYPGGLDRKAS